MTYTLLVYEDEEDGGYWAEVRRVIRLLHVWDTLDELLNNVPYAVAAYMGALEATASLDLVRRR
jgi:predicted RNase H-like HicB family nuclease